MILVVSDTSAIRALAHLDCLTSLPALFDKVVVPPSVNKELLEPPKSFRPVDVVDYGFISVKAPSDAEGVRSLNNVVFQLSARLVSCFG